MTMRKMLVVCLILLATTTLAGCSTIERMLGGSGEHRSNGGMFTELNLAIRDDDLEKAKKMIAEGADVNEAANYGGGDAIYVSNLSLAINFNDDPYEMVVLLMENGARLEDDIVALYNAIEDGHYDVIQYLLDNGLDPNEGMQSAVTSEHLDILQLLLDYGADPNEGVTLAKLNYNEEALKMLYAAGATVEE
ncbi:ankyrin repeat domain-containing protein [Saccharibacillus sp. CPCC 101409]|uniref:ankyrin repeat domain-containing protein n=1 Tax=Saccharibacillus sp. CPCC 101409 TaxID=3058041 RepID=UPI0026712104|nr:ankyrin repeat domain-containing protein [Saccharibacillus sp. CPCC 101409]MDO3411483.1 ankyrin repeat domain-containing protein [Saccharibacillus sp. CPCC 101409]